MKRLLAVVVISIFAVVAHADTCGCGAATPANPRCAAETLATAAEHVQAPVTHYNYSGLLFALAFMVAPWIARGVRTLSRLAPQLVVKLKTEALTPKLLRRSRPREQVALAEVAR